MHGIGNPRFRKEARFASYAGVMLLAWVATGCGGAAGPAAGVASPAGGEANSPYRLPAEPADAKDLDAVFATAEDGDQVVLVGRIGGRGSPWVDNLAAFTLVDLAAEAASSCCPTPGPNCDASGAPYQALIRVVDGNGRTIATGAQQLLGIERSQTVVVQGTTRRDEAGNLTVLADGVFVRP